MKINIDLTDAQHQKLCDRAARSSMSIEDYIIFKLFGNTDDVDKLVEETLKRINNLTPGTEFNIKLLWNVEWSQIKRGTRLSLGKRIFAISKSVSSGFTATSKDKQNTQWYIKD